MPGKEGISPTNGGVENRARELEPRPFKDTIVALDVDGVLVRPLAYRQAIRLTINFFTERIGVNAVEFMIDDRLSKPGHNMRHFETEGVHDPWDVSAIIVSLMKLKKAGVDVSNGQALEAIKMRSGPQSHPPEVILGWILDEYRQMTNETMQDVTKSLSQTRDPFNNEVTSVFQEYVLGREAFEETYGKSGRTGAEESLIKTRDRPLIDDNGRSVIKMISEKGGMVVIYTGRPGLPPPDIETEAGAGYAPEAELAVEKSKVKPLGIVSMGSMEWLGRVTGTPVEKLTKPNPTQALATILSALRGGTDSKVLMDAHRWGLTGELPPELQPFRRNFLRKGKELKIVVMEDSPSGVIAFINAKKILENDNVNVKVTAIGVHDVNLERHMAFQQLKGVDILETYSGMNEGIVRYAFGELAKARKAS